jgi:hypothetical protein
MRQPAKIDYQQLKRGFCFPPARYCLDAALVQEYRELVGESDVMVGQRGLAPPLLVAAGAMSALSEGIAFPPGSVHVSQEFCFHEIVPVGAVVDCTSSVIARQQRGSLCLLSLEIVARDDGGQLLLSGKLGFILPVTGETSGI